VEQCVDGLEEGAYSIGLGDDDADTGGESQVLYVVAVHGEDNGPRLRQLFLEDRCDLDAVQLGHEHVQDEQVGREVQGGIDGLLTIRGFGADFDVLLFLKEIPDQPADQRAVVGDKNAGGHCVGYPTFKNLA
jgi:hypothetical protein